MKPYTFHPEAAEEYAQAAEYYANILPKLGERFYDETERMILEVRRQPDRFLRFSPPPGGHYSACSLIRWCIWINLTAFGLWQ